MTLWNKLKNYFIAGLVAILPLWITYLIGKTILRFLIELPAGFSRPFLQHLPYLQNNELLLKLFSFFLTISIIILMGILLTNVMARKFFNTLEKAFQKVPLISWIYTAIRKLTALFASDEMESRFKRVVMFEYPRKDVWAMGLLTTDCLPEINEKTGKDLVNVFLPTTPNPTSGYLLLVPREDLIILNISTEDAVKLIVSGGVFSPGED